MTSSRLTRVALFATLALVLVAIVWPARSAQDENAPKPVPLESLLADLKAAPKTNDERERMLQDLYVKAGAKPDEIRLMDVSLNGQVAGHNVMVLKKGETATTIVLGGHLDKVNIGDGIIDDWSGCIIAKNIYQALRETKTKHNMLFVGFTMEERGLLGSRQFVQAAQDSKTPEMMAMANFECFGVSDPHIWANVANEKMKALAHKVAREQKIGLTEHTIPGTGADNVPFERAGIPSITLDGLPIEKIRLIHSVNDNFENIVPASYETGYKLGLEFVRALDRDGLTVASGGRDEREKMRNGAFVVAQFIARFSGFANAR